VGLVICAQTRAALAMVFLFVGWSTLDADLLIEKNAFKFGQEISRSVNLVNVGVIHESLAVDIHLFFVGRILVYVIPSDKRIYY
jgi:hypothetical protein